MRKTLVLLISALAFALLPTAIAQNTDAGPYKLGNPPGATANAGQTQTCTTICGTTVTTTTTTTTTTSTGGQKLQAHPRSARKIVQPKRDETIDKLLQALKDSNDRYEKLVEDMHEHQKQQDTAQNNFLDKMAHAQELLGQAELTKQQGLKDNGAIAANANQKFGEAAIIYAKGYQFNAETMRSYLKGKGKREWVSTFLNPFSRLAGDTLGPYLYATNLRPDNLNVTNSNSAAGGLSGGLNLSNFGNASSSSSAAGGTGYGGTVTNSGNNTGNSNSNSSSSAVGQGGSVTNTNSGNAESSSASSAVSTTTPK